MQASVKRLRMIRQFHLFSHLKVANSKFSHLKVANCRFSHLLFFHHRHRRFGVRLNAQRALRAYPGSGRTSTYLPHGAMPKSLAQAARLRRRPARPPCCARRRERRRCAQARPHHPAQSTRSPRASCPALHVPDRAPPFADPTAVCLCRATAGLGRAEQAPRAWRRRGAHPLLEV